MPPNAKLNAESFIGLVKQSNLVDPDLLKKTWKELQERGIDGGEAQVVAEELVSRNVLTRWQADKLLQRKHKGFFLGKYRLLSHLGSGGMSAVYLAEHVLMRRRVAIKVLPEARVADSSYLQRFHREAQAVAALDHRNIVRAYDVDQEGKIHFLVMEFVPGKSLHELVTSAGRLDYVPAVEYARQAAEGLQHAHRMGMVHRDIKPGNLLLDEKGTVKLLDLGLARFFDEKDESSLTIQHDEKVLGTADFLSPEQAIDSHKVDVRSDIYSLGCTLYFFLAGRPPFPDGSLAQRLLAHQNKEPERLASLRPDVPASLVAILDRMMAKKPADRYQTARDASAAMLQWLIEHGGTTWAQMNPVAPGGGSPIPVASKPSSDVLESETVSHRRPPGAGATAIGPRSSAAATTGAPPADKVEGALPPTPHEETSSEGNSEPELAAFLSHLATDDGHSRSNTVAASSRMPLREAPFPTEELSSAAGREDPPVVDYSPSLPPALSLAGATREKSTVDIRTVNAADKVVRATGRAPSMRAGAIPDRFPVTPEAEGSATNSAPEAPSGKSARSRRPAGALSSASNIRLPSAATKPPTLDKRLIAGGIAGVVLLLGYAGYSLLGRRDSTGPVANPDKKSIVQQNDPVKPSPPPRTGLLRRELSVGPSGAFRSITAALADAKRNGSDSRKATQIIKVAAGQTYYDRIVIDDTYPRGIQIVAEDGPPTILAPPGSEPIVVIGGGQEQVENFRLEGFQLHAVGKEVAVQLIAWAPAAKLKRLRISGFLKSGVLLDGTQTFGAENDRIVFEELTFREAAPEAVGIQFRGQTEDPMHIRLQRCRFFAPLSAGVSLDSGVIDVEILESIFHGTRTGVRLAGADRTWRDVVVAFNTFYENDRGVVFTDMPGAASGGFGFYNNLFVGSQTVDVLVEKGYDVKAFFSMLRATPGGASHNWTTRPKLDPHPPEQLPFLFDNLAGRYGATDLQFVSFDPDQADFLAPSPSSPHRQVGTLLDRRRFGDQVGAVRGK